MPDKKNLFLSLVQFSFYFLPISIVLGSLIVNINVIVFVLLGLIYLNTNRIKIKFNLINCTLLLFFLTIIFSTLINIEILGMENLIKSFFLLKFFFIYIILETFILNNKINLKIFFNILLFLIILVSLDVALQLFSGKNILGFEPHDGRVNGIFGHEAIVGGFIQKTFIFSLISLYLILFSNIKYKNLLYIVFFIITLSGVFFSSNRMSLLILISLFFVIFLFFKVFRKNLLISLILFIPICFFSLKIEPQLYIKFNNLKNNIVGSKDNTLLLLNNETKLIAPASSNHAQIYFTTIKSFNENIFIGNGLKSFRFKCKKFLNQKNTVCSTHSHNYHLEVLHDTGILGFSLISIFVFLLIFSRYKDIRFSSLEYKEKIIISLLLLNFIIEVFPIKSTGSIFTTWNGTILWVSIALVNYGKKKN